MTLIGVLVALVIVVVIVWAIRTVLPLLGLPAPIQTVIYVIVVVIVILWLLSYVVGLPRVYR